MASRRLRPSGLVALGALGSVSGTALSVRGVSMQRAAAQRWDQVTETYRQERDRFESLEAAANSALRALGHQQELAFRQVVFRMADFLRQNQKVVSESEKYLIAGLDAAISQVVPIDRLEVDQDSWMAAVVAPAAVGLVVKRVAFSSATKYASASTGTRIRTLSGAARRNAVEAYFGGGSLAAGGGGRARGRMALGTTTVGVAVLISGLVVAGQGYRADTKARDYEQTMMADVRELRSAAQEFAVVVRRAVELGWLLDELTDRAVPILDHLESEPFDPVRSEVLFQQAYALTLAIRDVATVHVIDESNKLNAKITDLEIRYRRLLKETEVGRPDE